MHPGHPPHNEFNRPEYYPSDYINVLRDIVDDESTTDSESSTHDHSEVCFWTEIFELLTWVGITVKTSLLSAFPFLE